MATLEEQREALEELLALALNLAKSTLERRGSFHPFALALNPDGSRRVVEEALSLFRGDDNDMMRIAEMRIGDEISNGRAVAAAIAADVTMRDPASGKEVDAIAVSLRHASGMRQSWTLRYSHSFLRGWRYKEPQLG